MRNNFSDFEEKLLTKHKGGRFVIAVECKPSLCQPFEYRYNGSCDRISIFGNRILEPRIRMGDFYNITSFAYCVFLQDFYSEPNLRRFRFLIYPSGSNYPVAKEVLYLPDAAYAEKEREDLSRKHRKCCVLIEE